MGGNESRQALRYPRGSFHQLIDSLLSSCHICFPEPSPLAPPFSCALQMWFATVVDELLHGDSDAGGNPSETPSHDDETKHFLLDKFGDWHTPVASLLRSTKPGTIGREDARAMSRRGLRAVADAGAASRRRQRSREKAQSGGFGDGTDGDPVVLVGDAAHTVSASVGLEAKNLSFFLFSRFGFVLLSLFLPPSPPIFFWCLCLAASLG